MVGVWKGIVGVWKGMVRVGFEWYGRGTEGYGGVMRVWKGMVVVGGYGGVWAGIKAVSSEKELSILFFIRIIVLFCFGVCGT